jgi:hypothetical protein
MLHAKDNDSVFISAGGSCKLLLWWGVGWTRSIGKRLLEATRVKTAFLGRAGMNVFGNYQSVAAATRDAAGSGSSVRELPVKNDGGAGEIPHDIQTGLLWFDTLKAGRYPMQHAPQYLLHLVSGR